MDEETRLVCEKVENLIANLTAQLRAGSLPPEICAIGVGMLVKGQAIALKMLRSGSLTAAEWPKIEAQYRVLARAFTNPRGQYNLMHAEVEWASFVDKLTNRQGTHLPDWSTFYAERDELERKIQERGEN